MQRLLLTVALFLFGWITTVANPRDTLQAQVMYGNDLLLEKVSKKSGVALTLYLDSIKAAPNVNPEYIEQVSLFTQIKNNVFTDMYTVIDSLFSLQHVPLALVNQINLLISAEGRETAGDHNETIRCITQEQYPADNVYPNWVTTQTQPYNSKAITTEDTAFYLDLLPNDQQFVMPVNDVLTSRFGWRDGRPHNGIDIDLQVWDTVVAAFDGVIRVARTCGGYGRTVIIRHHNGLETTYAHLHRLKVKPGQEVKAGELIGLGGSSGKSTGSHLHFEIRYKGKPINPLHIIDYQNKRLMCSIIYMRKTSNKFAAYPYGSEFYTVQNGDYLYKIANELGVPITTLCTLNGISRNTPLRVGQKLRFL
jgi:murein DD-endopeptidase MepM/ murein hydrolase activator NlpD